MRQDVRLIAAVGKHGQIGLRGQLPWTFDPIYEARFAANTAGGVLVLGWRTAARMNGRKLVSNRRCLALVSRSGLSLMDGSGDLTHYAGDILGRPDRCLLALAATYPGRPVWVAGGETIFEAFMPLCNGFDVTVIDYDGPADCYLPVPWETTS